MKLRTLLVAATFGVGAWGMYTLWAADERRDPPAVERDPTPVAEVRGRPSLVSYADVLDKVRPTVVSVASTRMVNSSPSPFFNDPFFRRFFGTPPEGQQRPESGLGSGVIVSPDGYILTNNHVVEGADKLQVDLADDRRFEAKLIGADPQTDIAVIKIEATDLPVATLGDSEVLRIGDIVFALGNPLGVGQTVTQGIISAKSRRGFSVGEDPGRLSYQDFLQTDAAINRGNSGGPLVDAAGRVVGINSMILSPSGGNIGIGFAIPINLVANVMNGLVTTGEVQRGYLGINIDDVPVELATDYGLDPNRRGALVTDVVPEGPAAKAGLQRDDVVTRVDDRVIRSGQDLRLTVSQIAPGTMVRLTVVRDKKELVLEVTLGRLDQTLAAAGGTGGELLEGVTVTPLSERLRSDFSVPESVESGLVVTAIENDSPYRRFLPAGAVIIAINRIAVADVTTAREALRPGRRNWLLVYYNGRTQLLELTVPSR